MIRTHHHSNRLNDEQERDKVSQVERSATNDKEAFGSEMEFVRKVKVFSTISPFVSQGRQQAWSNG
jgi:hypothetical protein